MSQVGGLALAALCLAACGGGTLEVEPTKPLTAREMLETCSTYLDAAGKHYMEFKAPGKVELNDFSGSAPPESGSYLIDSKAQTVTVEISGRRTSYSPFTPPGLDECILLSGTSAAANLNASWFGHLNPPDDGYPPDGWIST